MKMAKDVAKANVGLIKSQDYPPMRKMTDFMGTYYRLVLESQFPDLGAFEKAIQRRHSRAPRGGVCRHCDVRTRPSGQRVLGVPAR